ncbi:MAG: hypothetical protein WAM14_10810 [Candidatus Nitrosopolaris sp.]
MSNLCCRVKTAASPEEEFIDREKDYLKKGGNMLFPLPEFLIIDRDFQPKKPSQCQQYKSLAHPSSIQKMLQENEKQTHIRGTSIGWVIPDTFVNSLSKLVIDIDSLKREDSAWKRLMGYVKREHK